MKQPSRADRAITQALRQQGGLITRQQVLATGTTEAALRYRTRSGGSWGTVLPGIYLDHRGPLTPVQREIAAVLYAGNKGMVTGLSAMHRQGVRVPVPDFVDVLIPDSMKLKSAAFVRTHRTARMPEKPWISDGLRWAPIPRALADAARWEQELDEVRALVASAVQQRKTTIGQLSAELQAGPTRTSSTLRAALAEVADGVRSAAEGDLRKLIKYGKLPEPLYNPRLYVGGEFLAQPDAWWRDAGVAGEVDSREWHLSPAHWSRTMERHAAMTAKGILVVHVTPQQIRMHANRVVTDLRSAIEAGRQRPELGIRVVPVS